MTWSQIMGQMHFSSRSLFRWHFRGLNNISGLGFARGLINGYGHGINLNDRVALPLPWKRDNPLINTDLDNFDPLAISSGEEALRAYSHESGMLRWNVNFSSAAGALFCKARMLSLFTARVFHQDLIMQIYFSQRQSFFLRTWFTILLQYCATLSQ